MANVNVKTELDYMSDIINKLDDLNIKMEAMATYLRLYMEDNK